MHGKRSAPRTIDEYIDAVPEPVRGRLRELRSLILGIVPDAEERISYQIPTFYLKGNLVHFAAFAHHIGFYPTSSGVERFKEELSGYVTSKGAIQFPHSRPLPMALIERIVRFRVQEATSGRKA